MRRNSKSKELAKIEIEKSSVAADGKSSDTPLDETDASTFKALNKEKELIGAIRLLLRNYGIRKSGAAIRDAVEMPHDVFGPSQAVSALSQFGFKTSFGNIKITKLSPELFPLVAF